jgi:hypothetical protein
MMKDKKKLQEMQLKNMKMIMETSLTKRLMKT